MSADSRARFCSLRFFYGAAVLVAATLAACEQGTNEEPATPVNKAKTQDKTEVRMEVSTPPPDPAATTNTTNTSVATTGSPSTPLSGGRPDPEDPNLGGVQDPVVEKGIAPIRPRIRACYKKALAAEPNIGGNATFDATLGKDGRVTNVRFVKRDGLNEDMVGCLLTAVKNATFDPNQTTRILTFSFGSPLAPPAAADAGATGAKR